MRTKKTGKRQNTRSRQQYFLKNHKLIGLAVICIMVLSLSGGFNASPVQARNTLIFSESQLTSNNADQVNPDIYEYDYNSYAVIWQDNRNGNWDVYMYYQTYLEDGNWDTQWETRITANNGNNTNPKIYNDTIVYQSDRNGNWDIYMYSLTSKIETQITTNTSNQESPAIFGDIIVWQDWRNVQRPSIYLETYPGMSIYMYNLTSHTEQRLALPEQACFYPSISGDNVVYIGENYGTGTLTWVYPYVCSYNLSTGQKYNVAAAKMDTVLSSYQPRRMSSPAVDGTLVAWTLLDGGFRVVVGNVTAGASWVSGEGHQNCADVSKNYVVYQSCSDSSWDVYLYEFNSDWNFKRDWDIYLYDFNSNSLYVATDNTASQQKPAISTEYANFIVYQDNRNGNWDIYLNAPYYGGIGGPGGVGEPGEETEAATSFPIVPLAATLVLSSVLAVTGLFVFFRKRRKVVN